MVAWRRVEAVESDCIQDIFGISSQQDLLLHVEIWKDRNQECPQGRWLNHILMNKISGKANWKRGAMRVMFWTRKSICCLKENIQVEVSSVSCTIQIYRLGLGLQIRESLAYRCFLRQEAEKDHLGESE